MNQRFRVQLYWPGRDDTLPQLTEQLGLFLQELGQTQPKLAGLAPIDRREPVLLPVPRAQQLSSVLLSNAIQWQAGGASRVSYAPRFALQQAQQPPVEFKLTVGIPVLPVGPALMANRLEFFVRAELQEFANQRTLLGILQAGVHAFAPRWGYIGLETLAGTTDPDVFNGRARCGLDYLPRSQFFFRESTTWQTSGVYPLNGSGSVVVSQEELFDQQKSMHLQALEYVQQALRDEWDDTVE